MACRVRVVAIVQARLDSKRFPRKVIADLAGSPALKVLLLRLSQSKLVDEIVVAGPEGDKFLREQVQSWGFWFHGGSEKNVLER